VSGNFGCGCAALNNHTEGSIVLDGLLGSLAGSMFASQLPFALLSPSMIISG
jgi:hypothetical protein